MDDKLKNGETIEEGLQPSAPRKKDGRIAGVQPSRVPESAVPNKKKDDSANNKGEKKK